VTRTILTALTGLALLIGRAAAQDTPASEQAPGLFKITDVGKDAIELKGAGSTTHRPALRDLDIYDATGKKLTTEEFLKRVKVGTVVVVAADESRVDPAFLNVLKEDTVILVGVTVVLARADRPGRGWTLDLDKMKPGEAIVAGKILGADFKPDTIQLLNTGLSLRSGKDLIHIFLNLKPGQGIEGKTFEFDAEGQGGGRPAIHVHIHSTKPIGATAYTRGYAMRLEFGKEKDGMIPGKLYLCLPDDRKSWIAGSFTLTLR
jgi:hypothetical protein